MKRFKWEMPALMVLLLGLGAWLVWSSKSRIYGIETAPGAEVVELRIGNSRGVVEVTNLGRPDLSFRVLLRDGFKSPAMDAEHFKAQYGQQAIDGIVARGDNFVFRLLNITSWANLVWAFLGLAGQVAFFGRMFIQWLISEKHKQSIVPPAFWWFSLVGGILLFTYFVWRQDFVGVLGQSTGVVIYARNIRLIYKERRRAAAQAQHGHEPLPQRPSAVPAMSQKPV